jgi:hypothetical protein
MVNLPGDPFAALATWKLAGPCKAAYSESMTDSHRPDGPHCPVHPETALICPRCIASKGGKSRSRKKRVAVRESLKLARRNKKKLARERKKLAENLPADPGTKLAE